MLIGSSAAEEPMPGIPPWRWEREARKPGRLRLVVVVARCLAGRLEVKESRPHAGLVLPTASAVARSRTRGSWLRDKMRIPRSGSCSRNLAEPFARSTWAREACR